MTEKKNAPFRGTCTALVTPFDGQGVDYAALEKLLLRQLDAGVAAVAVCSTTGEGASLTAREYGETVRFAYATAGGRIPILAGAGGTSTSHAAELAYIAGNEGASAVLAVTPYYYKVTDEGIVLHFSEVSRAGLPVVAYNVPSRTGVTISRKAYFALAENEGIVGVKEASGNIEECAWLSRTLGDRFALYSGTDSQNLPLLSVGFDGFISVTANVRPEALCRLYSLWERGDTAGALDCDAQLAPLTRELFRFPNPIPVKAKLASMGLCKNILRLPLSAIAEN